VTGSEKRVDLTRPNANQPALRSFDPTFLPIQQNSLSDPSAFLAENAPRPLGIRARLVASTAAQPSKRPGGISNGKTVLNTRAGLAD
jgi:hypothetical protein